MLREVLAEDKEGMKTFACFFRVYYFLSNYLENFDMSQIIIDSRISKGHLRLQNIPLADDTEVKVIVIPKANLSKLSFKRSQNLTKSIRGNLSDDIISERRDI